MKLSEAREKFKDEWMAFNKKEEGDDPEGEVVLHHNDRDIFDKELLKLKAINIYMTFNGRKEGVYMLTTIAA